MAASRDGRTGKREDTLVQEMLKPAPVPLDEGRPGYLQAGEYVLLGKLAGFLVRTSAAPLIAPDYRESVTAPVGVEVPWRVENTN